ncbi:DUF5133 domain-containing protein [Streptomyces sp. NPDC054863]
MLTPNSHVLRTLLARHASARMAFEELPSQATRLALADVTYTLCVTTSTTDIEQALAAADFLLDHGGPPHDQ